MASLCSSLRFVRRRSVRRLLPPFIAEFFAHSFSAFFFAATMMYRYVEQAVNWMMTGGSSRNNFLPLLWAGARDWEISSAWTRGVVGAE